MSVLSPREQNEIRIPPVSHPPTQEDDGPRVHFFLLLILRAKKTGGGAQKTRGFAQKKNVV